VKSKTMVTITIDGRSGEVDEGKTVLEAARGMGIDIPTLCHYQAIDPYGACRVCIVEVNDGRGWRLTASCSYPVQDGLEVKTNSQRVLEARKVIVELILARCPDAPKVQALAKDLGITETQFETENEDCILCGLCARACEELMGVSAINFVGRGPDRKVSTPFEELSETCMSCGACAFVCPTGARAFFRRLKLNLRRQVEPQEAVALNLSSRVFSNHMENPVSSITQLCFSLFLYITKHRRHIFEFDEYPSCAYGRWYTRSRPSSWIILSVSSSMSHSLLEAAAAISSSPKARFGAFDASSSHELTSTSPSVGVNSKVVSSPVKVPA